MTNSRPLLAITMGDPAGIGPETIVRAWADPLVHEICRPIAIGYPSILRRAVQLLRSPAEVLLIESLDDAVAVPGVIPCLLCGSVASEADAENIVPATIDPRAGQAAYDALMLGVDLALAGRVDGLVTAPLHKAALWRAGHHYPGHTELLAERCGVKDFAMMLYLGPSGAVRGPAGLGVIHVTLHMALRDVFANLTPAAILTKIRLADGAFHRLRQFHGLGDSRARIGVAALNPHAGEEGLFGDEENSIITPAVEQARAEGFDAVGPLPTDTLMTRARDGQFDAVVAMYHDQGHIALKLLDMHRAVNITLGLPIVRTSVAHGTAFDLAWQGRAESSGMIEAIRVAAGLAGVVPKISPRSIRGSDSPRPLRERGRG
jgi:4-hydroxythreonine-4-phosphate dehydrogenase